MRKMKTTSKIVVFLIDKNKIYSYNNKIVSGGFIMEEEKLKIVEMKKCCKKVNRALFSKCLNMFLAAISSWAICYDVQEFIEDGKVKDLALAFCMLYCFIEFLKRSREKTEIINENLNKEIELEEQAIKEGLVK